MITYRRKPRLRVRRFDAPEPPFFAATLVQPYSSAPSGGLVFEWVELTARAASSTDATVAIETSVPNPREPLIADGTPEAEAIFAAAEALDPRTPIRSLSSAREQNDLLVFWPPEVELLKKARFRGLIIPVIYPVTTDLQLLAEVIAVSGGTEFVTAAPIELDATAKRAVAERLAMPDEDERYEILFHDNLEPITLSTERHIAALAGEAGLVDHVPIEGRSNWSAASMLALAGSRLLKMGDVELGLTVLRSSRAVALTEKPLQIIAESASLSIIDALDDISAEALTQWLEEGDADFFRDVSARWPLRRDYAPDSGDEA